MQVVTNTEDYFIQRPGFFTNVSDCLATTKNKTRTSWVVEQLNIEPYQQILEIGYGNGSTLQEVGKKMRAGFLAGIDESVSMYQSASRRNKKLIAQELLQLHIGTVSDLPYPPHYFHTIYGNNSYPGWKEPQFVFMQLASMLKTGGKLVMVFQPGWAKSENDTWQVAEEVQEQYIDAGFSDVRISFREMDPVNAIAVVGCKG